MLTADNLKDIVEALRDDIQNYIAEVRSDTVILEPLFAQIDTFLKNIAEWVEYRHG